MLNAEQLKHYIQQALACDYIAVKGDDGLHFEAIIVSAEFSDKNMVQQHQLVYRALGDKMRSEIHALSIRTFTPEVWAQTTNLF